MIRAKKIGGSYQAEGTIVSTFTTLAGETRHVFEFDQPAGMLHIFGPGQVEIAAAPQVVSDERALLAELLEVAEGLQGSYAQDHSDWDDPAVFAKVRTVLAAAPVQNVTVPDEPTEAMLIAGGRDAGHCSTCGYDNGGGDPGATYRAMRAAAPVQAQEPVADIDDAFSIAAAGCMFGNADAVESAKHWFKAGHAMGRGAAVREYADNGTFPAPVQPVAAPDGVTLRAFQANDDKSWWISFTHPYGSTSMQAKQGRDIQLAQLIAATPAAQGDAAIAAKAAVQ